MLHNKTLSINRQFKKGETFVLNFAFQNHPCVSPFAAEYGFLYPGYEAKGDEPAL